MKQLKKLTRNQKVILSKLGLNATEYGLVSENKKQFVIGDKINSETIIIKYTSSTSGEIVKE